MTLYAEIKKWFSTEKESGYWELETLPKKYPAYVVKDYWGYGVAIIMKKKELVINEMFSNCYFFTERKMILGKECNVLYFLCRDYGYYIEFASICAQLVDPGEKGEERNKINRNPLDWWNNWKNLIGNATLTKQVYSIIAELMVLEYLFKKDKTVVWTGAKGGTNDIENEKQGFEVKSTVKREGYVFTASSEFQMITSKTKKLSLFFCRMEKSPAGLSIDEMIKRLAELGYEKANLEHDLQYLGLPIGNSARKEKYKIIEKRVYKVTKSFPRIVPESFKNNVIPKGITHIVYNVDLGAIKNYTSW